MDSAGCIFLYLFVQLSVDIMLISYILIFVISHRASQLNLYKEINIPISMGG